MVSEPEVSELLSRYGSRTEIIASLRRSPRVDLLVIGGGIHGACVARLAAFNGLKTVLLERDDYAFHTSSRSSKMLHGGLRYLELGDIRQVFEGLAARATWFGIAPHLARWCPFMVPIPRGDRWYRAKLKVGLGIYDLLAWRDKKPHAWLPSDSLAGTAAQYCRADLGGAYRYFDGIMDDARLTIEVVVGARDEGALTLNHAEVVSVGQPAGPDAQVVWRDCLTSEQYTLRAGVVVNCAGPWAPWIGRSVGEPVRGGVRYSRGVHLIFRKLWRHEALFLPLEERGRYYWVWPHPSGALVGTTEDECTHLDADPQPTQREIEQILRRLRRDIPEAGLDESTMITAFCGVRTMALKPGGKGISSLSRRHRWSWEGNMLTLRGGKYTTAMSTADEALRLVWKRAKPDRPLVGLKQRPLPGAEILERASTEFRHDALGRSIDPAVIDRAIATWGGRVRFIGMVPHGWDLIGGVLLRGEVALAMRSEQAETIDDLLKGRLGLHHRGMLTDELRNEVAVVMEQMRMPEQQPTAIL